MSYYRKRKETEANSSTQAVASGSASSNRLLAGYLAHEFLTKGTLLGQKFDPARVEAFPVRAETKRMKPMNGSEPSSKPPEKSYAEVASLLKMDGAHVAGVVNPTQLARWIQM